MKLNIHSLAALAMMTISAAADFTCVGDCKPLLPLPADSVDCYILTEDLNNEVGAVWAGLSADITTDFAVSAKLYFGDHNDGADGIAFVIQNVLGNSAVGKDGGRLGFLDIGDYFAVDVDTYWNHNLDEEMLSDHVFVSSKNSAFGDSVAVYELENGGWHDFAVTWDATSGAMVVSLDNAVVSTENVTSISAELNNATTAFFGFTAATGGYTNLQKICDISIPGDTAPVVEAAATAAPTNAPTKSPTVAPTAAPTAAPTNAAPAVSPILIPECEDFAVFGRTKLTFGATSAVHNGHVGSITTITEAGVALDDGFFAYPSATDPGTSECADAIAAAVAAFKIAGPDATGDYTPIAATIPTNHVFTPGKYFAAATLATAAGVKVIFDAGGDADAAFTIQAGSTLNFGADTEFELRNGAKAQNILWEAHTTVGIGAGTAGADSHFVGSIIAGTTVTAGATMSFYGRIFANTAGTMAATNVVDPLHVVPFVTWPAARYLRH